MRTVYADAVFAINAAADYILLIVTAAVSGVPIKRRTAALASVGGGVYSVIAAVLGGAAASLPMKLAAGTALAVAAFGGRASRGRLTVIFFAVACGFAGVSGFGVVPGFAAGVAASWLWLRGTAGSRVRGDIVKVSVTCGGKSASFFALVDTGNSLTDPVTGAPVTVCDAECLEALTPRDTYSIPIATASGPGTLTAFRPDELVIAGKKQKNGVIAVSVGQIASGRGYSALTHASFYENT